MQLKLSFKTKEGFTVPFNYNHQIQSAIYRKLSEVGESDLIHDIGYGINRFKGFVFGALEGDYRVKDKKLSFRSVLSFELRSSSFEFIDAMQRSFELIPSLKFFDSALELIDMKNTNIHINADSAEFTANTPVIVHKKTGDGKTLYFSPEDPEFAPGLEENFIKKYITLTGETPGDISIEPFGNCKKTVTNYKGTWINAYKCSFIIKGAPEYLEFIYNTGLGAKNAQGFGMLDLI